MAREVDLDDRDSAPVHPLLAAPVVPSLLRLAGPNLLGLVSGIGVTIAETAYVGALGTVPLAAVALVFPTIMLCQMVSNGGMGAGVSSAISQAIGAGDHERANDLAWHAAVIAVIAGLLFGVTIWLFGPAFFHFLGGRGETLRSATLFAHIVFLGAVSIWLMNLLASVHRGSGNMAIPSYTQIGMAALQILVGGGLCFGWFGWPRLELVGVGLGQVATATLGAVILLLMLRRKSAPVQLRLGGRLRSSRFADILRVGGVASLSPFQSVATATIITALVARLGTEALAGYGIGSRLEFMALGVGFSFGIASLPMVGLAIGANQIARARRVAWTAGGLAALTLGTLGVIIALFPNLWTSHFTTDPAVLESANAYLSVTGWSMSFFGLAMALGFSSQGAGRPLGPLLGGTCRLLVVAVGGWIVVYMGGDRHGMFVSVALSIVAMAVVTAAFVAFTPWGRTARPA